MPWSQGTSIAGLVWPVASHALGQAVPDQGPKGSLPSGAERLGAPNQEGLPWLSETQGGGLCQLGRSGSGAQTLMVAPGGRWEPEGSFWFGTSCSGRGRARLSLMTPEWGLAALV